MPIAYVGAATPFSATGLGTTFTLNAPAGVAPGQRLYATVACWANGSQKTITATGWTVLNTAYRAVGSDYIQVTVLTRYTEAGDPSSWTATASGSVALRTAGVVAYSGVQETGPRVAATLGNGSSFSTGNVTNATAGSWRLVCGAYFSGSASYDISSNEVSRRWIQAADNSGAVQAASWDSNGTTVAVGTQSRTVSRSANWTCAGAVLILLTPSAGTPASGDLAGTLEHVEGAAEGEVHADATLAGTVANPTAAWSGYGQPPVVTGSFTGALAATTSSLAGHSDVRGTLAGTITPTAEIVAETRVFGVRVVNVEADDRTIKVESRAVAD